VIFGCADVRAGAAGSVMNLLQTPALNHTCEITSGVLESECAQLLQSFFKAKRKRTDGNGSQEQPPA
jgi:tRNA(adenine34) deaminase